MQVSICSSTILRAMQPTFCTQLRCSKDPAERGNHQGEAERSAVLEQEVFLLKTEQASESSGIVAAVLVGWGSPLGSITSFMTRKLSFRVQSGKNATGLSRQSELLPSACCVELRRSPAGCVGKCKSGDIAVYDLGLAAKTGDGSVTVEPDVF